MSIIIPIGIVILAMLIMASLQLVPSVFALFTHYALGKYSKKRTSTLSIFFILGTETISACLFLACYYLTYTLFFYFYHPETSPIYWIIVGILAALAIASLFFYYRRGSGTRLFIPRKYATALDRYASSVKTNSDAFLLGALSSTCELCFTLPLFILTSIELMEISIENYPCHLLTFAYILTPIIPLLFMRWQFQFGHNLADVQKTRIKDKNFIRFFLAFNYLTIALLMIFFRIPY